MLTFQPALREQLCQALNNGTPGWNDDESAVVQAVAELAVRRFFPPDYDVRQVTALAAEMREIYADTEPLDLLTTEAVIRSALGEADVDVTDIRPAMKYMIHGWAAGLVAMKVRWSKPEVAELVTAAEKIASGQGWKPPLAT